MNTRSVEIVCREINLQAVRDLPPLPSGFVTDRVYQLDRESGGIEGRWTLREVQLPVPFRKVYDSGRLEDWLGSYDESLHVQDLRFVAARMGERMVGLAAWYHLTWNDTVWLVDIRTRENVRRRGVGTALIRHVQEAARRLRARGVAVETQTNNWPALHFYARNGFVISGFNDHLYTDRDAEIGDVAVFLFWEAR